jgi:V/A-type H+-transporting ATPase subunit D
MGLLTSRARRKMAERGVALLRSKREALANEFFRLMQGVLAGRERLDKAMRDASRALTLSEALDGHHVLASLALAARREIPIAVERKKIWGVPTPEVTAPGLVRRADARGSSLREWPFGATEVAERHERALDILLAICSGEIHLTRLGEEIQNTSRRINALEQLMIPRLDGDIGRIASALQEREREELSRLKRLKTKKAG